MSESQVSIEQVKREISELLNRVAFRGERIVLTSRGKPKAVIVSLDDYERIQQAEEQMQLSHWKSWLAKNEALTDMILAERDGEPLDVDAIWAVTRPDDTRSHTVIDTLAWLIEDAFEGDPSHSLLANLHDLRDEDWTALPPGAGRSIADIVEHVAWCKWMYEDYAFGPATMRGDRPPLVPEGDLRSRPRDELLAWLKDGHERWLAAVRALGDDGELERDRLTNWGERMPTRTIIRIMIAHDLYHAGEINHLRALLQNTDRWEYD